MYLLGHLLLLGYRRCDLLLALFEIAQIGEPVKKLSEYLVVKRAGDLLAVSGDKRDGLSVIYKLNGVVHLLLF